MEWNVVHLLDRWTLQFVRNIGCPVPPTPLRTAWTAALLIGGGSRVLLLVGLQLCSLLALTQLFRKPIGTLS